MTWSSSAAEFNLQYLEQGRVFTLAITRAAGQSLAGAKLQFRHTPDGTWYDMPNFPTAASNIYVHEFRCFSPYMRLTFTGTAPYEITQVCASEATF